MNTRALTAAALSMFVTLSGCGSQDPRDALIGTWGAVQFPIVGWQPLKSMEQLGPLGIFFGLQFMQATAMMRVFLDIPLLIFLKRRFGTRRPSPMGASER